MRIFPMNHNAVPMRILIIEDEKKVADFISRGLTEAGNLADVAYNGGSGIERALNGTYDLIILDIMLPDMDGFEILEQLRGAGNDARVLLLTALDQTPQKIRGLNLGADDYLTKPFDFQELLARVHALLRRGREAARSTYAIADLSMDTASQIVLRNGRRVDLTHREFMLLRFLIEHRDEVVTRTMIAQHVWNLSYEADTNVIDVYINYLRRKIDDAAALKLIHTIRGQGYMLTEAP